MEGGERTYLCGSCLNGILDDISLLSLVLEKDLVVVKAGREGARRRGREERPARSRKDPKPSAEGGREDIQPTPLLIRLRLIFMDLDRIRRARRTGTVLWRPLASSGASWTGLAALVAHGCRHSKSGRAKPPSSRRSAAVRFRSLNFSGSEAGQRGCGPGAAP